MLAYAHQFHPSIFLTRCRTAFVKLDRIVLTTPQPIS
jgi:hypothetical protein